MRKNKLKELFRAGKPIINSWLAVPSSFSTELMANQGWDSLTIDMQHGLIDYSNAVSMLQAISTFVVFGALKDNLIASVKASFRKRE